MTDNVNVETLHFDADQKLLDYVFNKAEQLNKVYDRIETCDVVLKLEHDAKKQNKTVEINLLVPQKTLFSKNHAETFELATDMVVDELKLQLKKHKEKISDFSNTVLPDDSDIFP